MWKGKRERSDSISSVVTEESPFCERTIEFTASLPPAYIGNAHEGVEELLANRLLQYDERFGGVLLCYQHVKIKEGHGVVFEDVPELRFRTRFKGLVFAPKENLKLRGVVASITAEHVQLLIYEALQNDKDVLKLGTEVYFEVIKIHDKGGAWYLEGSLGHEHLGPVDIVGHLDEGEMAPKRQIQSLDKPKKHKKKAKVAVDEIGDDDTKKKKEKKRKKKKTD